MTATVDADVEALTVRQFCHRDGIGKTFLYSEIAAGRIRTRHAGRRTLIAAAEAAAWFANLPEHPVNNETAT